MAINTNKNILITPGIGGNFSTSISQIDFKWVESGVGTYIFTPNTNDLRSTIYNWVQNYEPVLLLGGMGTVNNQQKFVGPYVDYQGSFIGTSSFPSIQFFPLSGKIVGNTISVSGVSTFNGIYLNGPVYDINNLPGTNGQILSSTGSGIAWTTFSSVGIITGLSGTTNRLAKFLDEDTIGNSTISDNGTQITMGIGVSVIGFTTTLGFFGPGTNLTNLNASNLASGTVPSARVSGSYSGITSVGDLSNLNVTGLATAFSFFGFGSNLTNLNASNLASGTVNSARISGAYSGITSVGSLSQLIAAGIATLQNLEIDGWLKDSNNSIGSSGQILSSTGSGIAWTSSTSLGVVTGSGSANQVTFWSGANSITGLSTFVYQNNSLGIGTASPRGSLETIDAIYVENIYIGAGNSFTNTIVGLGVSLYQNLNAQYLENSTVVGYMANSTNDPLSGIVIGAKAYSNSTLSNGDLSLNIVLGNNAYSDVNIRPGGSGKTIIGHSAYRYIENNDDVDSGNLIVIGEEAFSGTATTIISDAIRSIIIGNSASKGNSHASSVIIGMQAGSSNIQNTSNNNVVIGNDSFLNSSGLFNVIVGDSSVYNNSSLQYSIAIGHNNTFVAGSSYQISIGNDINIPRSNAGAWGGNTNTTRTDLGIGTFTPLGRIHIETLAAANMGLYIAGAASQTGDLVEINATTVGQNYFTITGIGSVGIYTSLPTQALDLNGSIRVRNNIFDRTNSAGSNGQILSSTPNGIAWTSVAASGIITGSGTINTISKFGTVNSLTNSNITDNGIAVTVNSRLNVIGIASFTNDLIVNNITVGLGSQQLQGNLAIGFQAFQTATSTSASGNVAIGDRALQTTSGAIFGNVAIGQLALAVNSGLRNIAVGTQALGNNTSGSSNIAIGHQALQANTADSANIAIGYRVMYLLTGGGGSNIAIGGAGNLTTAAEITVLGTSAANNYTSQGQHVAIGAYALAGVSTTTTTGTQNTAVGYAAMITITSGSSNVGVGHFALYTLSSGNSNTALGYLAAVTNTTGSFNVAVGREALRYYSTISNQVAIGYQALAGSATSSLNTGTQNTAVGYQAGAANTSGSNNTFIGRSSGVANTSGSNNAFLGYLAGDGMLTGSNNTFVGDSTDGNQGGSYQIAIGRAVIPTSSNLGAWGGNTNATRTDLGIGTFTSLSRLHLETLAAGNMGLYIAGSASQTADLLEVNATTNGVNYFTVTGIGSVGVNTASPTSILHVNGDLRNDGRIILNSNNANLVNQRIFAGINSSINQTSFVGIASINIPLGYQLTIEGKINGWFSSSFNESGRFFAVFNNSIGIASLVGLTDITSKFVGSSGNFDIQARGTNAVIVTKSNNTANMWLWKASYDYLITQNV